MVFFLYLYVCMYCTDVSWSGYISSGEIMLTVPAEEHMEMTDVVLFCCQDSVFPVSRFNRML